MTPSPGVSVCLFNAMRDGKVIADMIKDARFNTQEMKRDLIDSQKD